MKPFQNPALIVGWTPDQWDQLHPHFRPLLQAVVAEAQQRLGLRVRFVSGHRTWAHQEELRRTYDERLAWWESTGKALGKPKPLPASKPGASAHNVTRWVTAPDQKPGPELLAPPAAKDAKRYVELPASAAVDVGILDHDGRFIRVGGQLALADRPVEWQAWARLLEGHPELRDGGTFKNIDAVHVEDACWSYTTHKLELPADA